MKSRILRKENVIVRTKLSDIALDCDAKKVIMEMGARTTCSSARQYIDPRLRLDQVKKGSVMIIYMGLNSSFGNAIRKVARRITIEVTAKNCCWI